MKNLIILLFFINLFAKEETLFLESLIKKSKDYRKYIHSTIVNTSSVIDNYYFEDKKYNLNPYNSSYGLLTLSLYQNQHEDIKFRPNIKLKLQLPRLKKKINLVFENEKKRESKDYIEENEKNNNYNLSILYNKTLKNSIQIRTKLGIKINKMLNPFLKIELKKVWENKHGLNLTLSQQFKQSVKKKLESTSYFLINKRLKKNLSLNNYNEYYWGSEDSKDSQFYYSIYLNKKLSKKSYLTYMIDTNIDNSQTNLRIKRYSLKIKYRHYLKKWLYLDTIPQNFYRYDLNFKPRYAIQFNLGVIFNK